MHVGRLLNTGDWVSFEVSVNLIQRGPKCSQTQSSSLFQLYGGIYQREVKQGRHLHTDTIPALSLSVVQLSLERVRERGGGV